MLKHEVFGVSIINAKNSDYRLEIQIRNMTL